MSKLVLTYKDFNGDAGIATFEGTDMTAGNFDAERTLQNALRDATNAITNCALDKYQVVALASPQQASLPVNGYAQREVKWLVRYHDSVTMEKGKLEIPGAMLEKLVPGTELADMTDTDIAAWVTAFEAYANGPDGNPPVVDSLTYVSR